MSDRFWQKVDRPSPYACWEWTAAKNGDGYGRFGWNGRNAHAHRVAYELLIGPIPVDREIDHLCRNRACVNPLHLEAVPRMVNLRRAGIPPYALANRNKTSCPKGHPYDEVNTYWAADGSRKCRKCKCASANAAQARRRREARNH